jgi:hypothetical protein
MVDSEITREKLFQCKIKGQSKPFVDQNLQIQIPGVEAPLNITSPSPIYSHYSSYKTGNDSSLSVNEAELYQAMEQAKQSYEAWKKMGQKLEEKAKSLKN